MGYSRKYREPIIIKKKSYALFNTIIPEDIEKLVKNGDDIDMQDSNGNTPLHKMIVAKRIITVKTLLKLGANPNIRNFYGQTPLHITNKRDMIELLLKYGASPYLPDNYKDIPYIKNSIVKEIVDRRFV